MIYTLVILLIILAKSVQDIVECPRGHFRLGEMKNCHPHLSCGDLDNMTLVRRIGSGAVKDIFLVVWRNMSLALSVPTNHFMVEDFMSGVETLRLLSPSKYIVQYIGFCDTDYSLFTEYYSNRDAYTWFSTNMPKLSLLESIGFCHQYSQILNYLHNNLVGPRVFCDSNSLEKLLSQLLVTIDRKLVLNDVDALPQVVNGSGVKCGHRQLFGSFVAPEQLWNSSEQFNDSEMPSYDEKTDIWKAPAVCDYFLKFAVDGEILKYRLFNFHKKCRNIEPSKRPSVEDLVNEYERVIEEFNLYHLEL